MRIPLKLGVAILILFFVFSTKPAVAQFGFETCLLSPNGDIGQYYKKHLALDFYLSRSYHLGRLRTRVGFLYTRLKPRQDTAPVYQVQTGGGPLGGNPYTQVVPGILVNHKMPFGYGYADFTYRIFKIKKFSLFAGLGFAVGETKASYYEEFYTVSKDETTDDNFAIGGRVISYLEYKINAHFDAFVQGTYVGMVTVDESTNLTHTTLGIGANYFISKRWAGRISKYHNDDDY